MYQGYMPEELRCKMDHADGNELTQCATQHSSVHHVCCSKRHMPLGGGCEAFAVPDSIRMVLTNSSQSIHCALPAIGAFTLDAAQTGRHGLCFMF